MRKDLNNLDFQYKVSDHRNKEREHHYYDNSKTYQYYQGLLAKKYEKANEFDYKQIELQAKKKREEEMRKAH